MKKIVLGYGLVIGILFCINMFIMVHHIYNYPEVEANVVLGYAAMVAMFSLIYFGVRNYRNRILNGVISFRQALKTGFLIAFLGSTLYVVVSLTYYYLFIPDFIDQYTAYVLQHCPAGEIETKTAELAAFKESYQNPLFVILITYFEILPVGVIVALISAFIVRKKA